jgi:HNH endonuclease
MKPLIQNVINKKHISRFNLKYEKTDSGCWNWIGYVNDNGYGIFSINNKQYRAHRVSYEIYTSSVPLSLDLDHLCRNRRCVNPNHLEPVTRKVNLMRSETACLSGGMSTARKKMSNNFCNRGHQYTKENTRIRVDHKGRRSRVCRTCRNKRANDRYYKMKNNIV